MIKKVEYWVKKDGQSRHTNLAWRNRNNEHFGWDDDADDLPLIKDNAPEPEPPKAPFPDIPAKFPGIPLKRDEPTPTIAAKP
jgi:hypothetical protein